LWTTETGGAQQNLKLKGPGLSNLRIIYEIGVPWDAIRAGRITYYVV